MGHVIAGNHIRRRCLSLIGIAIRAGSVAACGGGRNPLLVTPGMLVHMQNYADAPLLVARDKATGAELAAIPVPARARAAPMTYEHEGRQYLVIAVLSDPAPQLIAYALPD